MDTVAEFLTRVRNAGMAKHEKVDVPCSNIRVGLAKVLQEAGYIRSYKVAKDGKQGIMRVYLRYKSNGDHMIKNIQRISRPSKRIYVNKDKIPNVRSGYGLSILSTNKGVLSGLNAAKENVGGEYICKVW